jgi:hypothetical protein
VVRCQLRPHTAGAGNNRLSGPSGSPPGGYSWAQWSDVSCAPTQPVQGTTPYLRRCATACTTILPLHSALGQSPLLEQIAAHSPPDHQSSWLELSLQSLYPPPPPSSLHRQSSLLYTRRWTGYQPANSLAVCSGSLVAILRLSPC